MKYIECSDLATANDFKKVYFESFPKNERVDFNGLFSGVFKNFKLVGQYKDKKLVGMMHFLVKTDFIHLNYFAIMPDYRGQGYGSKCLSWLKRKYKLPIVVDVEELDPKSKNYEYRIKRHRFYMKNGMKHGKYTFIWQGEFFTYLHYKDINPESFMKHITYIFPTITNIQSYNPKL